MSTRSDVMKYADANLFQKHLRRFAASGPGSWLFARILHHIDRPVHRLTKGRHTFASLVSGLPVVMITTTGAKSGKPRTVPVLALPVDEGLAVVASNYGQHNNPAWYHNLRANPGGEWAWRGVRQGFRAVEATGERRARIWETGLKIYPGWTQYEKRAAHREITVFVLEREAGTPPGTPAPAGSG
jgi:deazaflavin-dependent oxidoreductase (nitroreductase family)